MNKKPFITFEGVDGAGKSTLAKRVSEEIGGLLLKSPPEILAKSRYLLNNAPESMTVHYYLTGNSMVSRIAELEIHKRPVVSDRYFQSTQVYHHKFITELPDHLQQDLIVYVSSSWNQIEQRLSLRSNRKSHERIDNLKRLHELYLNLLGKRKDVMYINTTNDSIEESVNLILQQIKSLK